MRSDLVQLCRKVFREKVGEKLGWVLESHARSLKTYQLEDVLVLDGIVGMLYHVYI